MPKYTVALQANILHEVEVEAESEAEAHNKVWDHLGDDYEVDFMVQAVYPSEEDRGA